MRGSIKRLIKIAAVTAGLVLTYEYTNLLLIFHYFKYEYYIAAVGLIALLAGGLITRHYFLNTARHVHETNPLDDLTNKELLVLSLISEGKTNKEIAAINFVELSTVKTHINNIYLKMGVKNRKSAIEMYRNTIQIAKSTFSPPSQT